VKTWLDLVTRRMNNVFLKSNLYKTLPNCHRDNGAFATAPISVEENFDKVIFTKSYPVGSYYIACDQFGRVNTWLREYAMIVRNVVETFGEKDANGKYDWSKFSNTVKQCYERGQYQSWIQIVHVIYPNDEYDFNSPFAKHKKFADCYYERGYIGGSQRNYMDGPDENKYLREAGHDYFPILCPRWMVNGEDAYGSECPGFVAIGDIKQLQHGEKVHGKALDKMVDPALVAPVSLQNSRVSILSGDITFVNERDGAQGLRAAHEVNLRIDHLDAKMDKIEYRISRAFYEDLFLMLAQSDRRQITATEIDERKEEKLLALGPVLEQLNDDLLDPLIDIVFDIMNRKGMIPPPPQELQGMPLRVEYISMMAQAQKMIGIGTHERFMNSMIAIGQARPDAWDKVNIDQYIDRYGDNLSVANGIVRTDEDVASIRAERAKAQQQQQIAQNLPAVAGAAKDLSETDMTTDSALSRLTAQARAGQLVNGA
jgi:head-to-tail connecting protein